MTRRLRLRLSLTLTRGKCLPCERSTPISGLGSCFAEVSCHVGPQGAKPKGEIVAEILAGIKERRA